MKMYIRQVMAFCGGFKKLKCCVNYICIMIFFNQHIFKKTSKINVYNITLEKYIRQKPKKHFVIHNCFIFIPAISLVAASSIEIQFHCVKHIFLSELLSHP